MEEKIGFKAAVAYIAERTGAPNKCVGHRDHKATACPGDERYAWVHAGMPVDDFPLPMPPDGGDDEMKPRVIRNRDTGACYVFTGYSLIPANDETYRNIVRWYAGQGEPWDDWSPEQIAAVPVEEISGAE